jgi:NADH-quinone oxidoreductase subunit E
MNASANDVGLLFRSAIADHSPDSEESYLIARLTEIQERYHYLPHPALVLLSETLDIPLAQIYAVATFYNAFSLKPRGAHLIRVCMGTACHVRGAPQILDRIESKLEIHAGETTRDRSVTLETVNCLGACALGPIVVADNEYAGQMDIAKADRLLKNLRAHDGKEAAHK